MQNLEQRWAEVKHWVSANARYFYFEPETGMYVLDQEAKQRNKPVAPQRQEPVPGPWCKGRTKPRS
jgi:hypothetical protein